ncbi:unnamed protein product [Protopolystoma xenopodis]|uniref:Uncharacterized protein n=1 Tax=Protopolystoma xenopodis TaxID=117903 RepID=A0A3S5FH34_9PLAT|nr:unnamed protein product [Protopolystoma xenopodis]
MKTAKLECALCNSLLLDAIQTFFCFWPTENTAGLEGKARQALNGAAMRLLRTGHWGQLEQASRRGGKSVQISFSRLLPPEETSRSGTSGLEHTPDLTLDRFDTSSKSSRAVQCRRQALTCSIHLLLASG